MIFKTFVREIVNIHNALDQVLYLVVPGDESEISENMGRVFEQCMNIRGCLRTVYDNASECSYEREVVCADDIMQVLTLVLPLCQVLQDDAFDSYFPIELFSEQNKILCSGMNLFYQWREYSVGKSLTQESGIERLVDDYVSKDEGNKVLKEFSLNKLLGLLAPLQKNAIAGVEYYSGIDVSEI